MSDKAMRRTRREKGALEAGVLEYLATEPQSTSVRAVGAAIGVPAGTAQQVLARLAREGKIVSAGTNGRATLWRNALTAVA